MKKYTDLTNISDLPEELRKELMPSKAKKLSEQILIIFREERCQLNIDEVMVALYRKHKIIHKREYIVNKVYRLYKDGLLTPVKGKKATYMIKEIEE